MQFYDVLASIIHDMKNSLSMVVHTLDDVTSDPDFKYDKIERITALQNEAKRLNNNLIELLTLYKIENERISPVIDEINVFEFYSEILAENQASARANSVALICQCEDELYGYFDEGLIRGVIDNLIGNGMRYTKDKLLLSADERDGYLVLRVDDNGQGYPQEMLEAQEAGDIHNRISEGRTQLGLYFASLIAQMHENKGSKGKIKLENHGQLDGGSFSIWLP